VDQPSAVPKKPAHAVIPFAWRLVTGVAGNNVTIARCYASSPQAAEEYGKYAQMPTARQAQHPLVWDTEGGPLSKDDRKRRRLSDAAEPQQLGSAKYDLAYDSEDDMPLDKRGAAVRKSAGEGQIQRHNSSCVNARAGSLKEGGAHQTREPAGSTFNKIRSHSYVKKVR
jgi:hypothetical protein